MSASRSAAIVVTGLPASGKSTLGRALADALDWPFLDKDDFLEALFEAHEVQDLKDRSQLSRQSDALFQAAAEQHDHVVLVSHWASRSGSGSGTPTGWLRKRFTRLVEIHCTCAPDIAAARFAARRRHPKHMDHLRPGNVLKQQMQEQAEQLPLRLGNVVTVSTEHRVDLKAILTSDQLIRVQS